jgi:hypothetical protein
MAAEALHPPERRMNHNLTLRPLAILGEKARAQAARPERSGDLTPRIIEL